MENGFVVGMKVSLDNESGIVIKDKLEESNMVGIICWDTSKENDTEDWRGQFETFIRIGGKVLDDNYLFQFIDDNGKLK